MTLSSPQRHFSFDGGLTNGWGGRITVPMPKYQEALPQSQSEDEKVVSWRLHTLISEAGYPNDIARQLAARLDVDLHQAVQLVLDGCTHTTAAEILL